MESCRIWRHAPVFPLLHSFFGEGQFSCIMLWHLQYTVTVHIFEDKSCNSSSDSSPPRACVSSLLKCCRIQDIWWGSRNGVNQKTQKPVLTLCHDNYCLTLKLDEKTQTDNEEDALTSITHSNVCEFVSLQIVMLNSLSDLYGYVDKGQLTCELGGNLEYCHSQWIHHRTVSHHDIWPLV